MRRDTELAIFVTPSIVSNDYAGFAQSAAQGRHVLEQAFPDPTQLRLLAPAGGAPAAGWSAPQGEGSQWRSGNESALSGKEP